jgi:apolipoprotein N-acyltransferase
MKSPRLKSTLPDWRNVVLAIVSALLAILAFPDFDLWFLAWVALVPLLWALDREHESGLRSFVVGWIWGLVFFTGSCWWLTFAPITYAGFPPALAYFLLICVTSIVAIFPGIFGTVLSLLFQRFGSFALFFAPIVWVSIEFIRYWLTGNNWNTLGYSQALAGSSPVTVFSTASGVLADMASVGGVLLTTFVLVLLNAAFATILLKRNWVTVVGSIAVLAAVAVFGVLLQIANLPDPSARYPLPPSIVAIQPNVPMAGLSYEKWQQLRGRHVELAESALAAMDEQRSTTTTVIFPESPMNFMYEDDEEFREFVHAFARKHDVQVLFNSAEPDTPNDKYFNSAVLVGASGKELAQYDKIYLVPFGESVPAPLQSIVPALVGSFSYGKEYDLLPLGDAKAGVMICFESHFGELSREYVRSGADAIIEMTNDGYLGPTPILRQHLANAVFRAIETNRPVLRVTNVGITAYITERGWVVEPSDPYTETTRVWSVAKSDASQTFYVYVGDGWIIWMGSGGPSPIGIAWGGGWVRRRPLTSVR